VDSRRAESFSDGVFAVAITVLVFNLLPIAMPGPLSWHALLARHWPGYAAYVVSFLTIGIMWLNHHGMLGRVTKVDRLLLVLNLILLMGIVAIPFPTALVADHLTGDRHSASVAVVTYGFVMIAISLGYASMWLHITARPERLGARRRAPLPLANTLRFIGGLAGYVAGTLIAAFGPPDIALALFGLLAVYYMFEHLPDAGGDVGVAAAGDDSEATAQ
jgi:uncharacterized membrane protein